MNKVINITPNEIKQAIDDLVNENEMLQDKVYKLEDIIKEAREYIKLVATDHDIMNNNEIIYTQMQYEEIENLLEILDKGENKE